MTMRDVFVAGAAMTRFAKQLDRSLKDLAGEATMGVLADAGMQVGDLEQVYFANAIGGAITAQEMVAGQVALRPSGIAGIPVINVENACASASTALWLGWQAIATGQADRVLCIGAEKMTHPEKERSLAAIGRAVDVEEVFGPEGPQPGGRSYFMDLYAREGEQLMEHHGATREDFAAVAAKNHGHGGRNPKAQYGGDITVEDVLAAREIVYPLTLPMCSPVSDGAAAVVLSSEPSSGVDGRTSSVRVAGIAIASGSTSATEGGNSTARAGKAAFEMAGIGPDDLDLLELHDAAAPAELATYESLGLAAPGDAPKLLRDKDTTLGGRLPVNVSGGLLAKGHPIGATGLAQIVEIVEQLRGEAGDRQVTGARTGAAQNGGGWIEDDNAAAVVSVLERVA